MGFIFAFFYLGVVADMALGNSRGAAFAGFVAASVVGYVAWVRRP